MHHQQGYKTWHCCPATYLGIEECHPDAQARYKRHDQLILEFNTEKQTMLEQGRSDLESNKKTNSTL